MNKNIKLLLGASSVAMLSICALQGCSSDATGTTTPGAGASSVAGATSTAGATSVAGAPAGGATGTAGAGTAGAATAGASTGGAATAGAGGAATAGAGGAAAGAGGATGGAGGATAGAGGAAAGAGGSGGAGKDCTKFCADEGTVCMFTGEDAAFTSLDDCTMKCGNFAVGDVAALPAGPTATDTYACRRWHLTKATGLTGADLKLHCGHTKVMSDQCK